MVKYFEKSIFNNLYIYLTTHNLITKNQSGFRPGDPTTNQLIDPVNEIHHAFDSTKSLGVRAVFLDISKAFAKVWHDAWFLMLLCSAEYSTIESGVPQGSVLGPLLFLIYIIDLGKTIKI